MTTITYQFAPIPGEIVASTIPSDPKNILNYMLFRQGIPGWKMRKADLCKTLGLTLYAVKKALKWLQKNGYASYTRAYGFTRWMFRATPASRVNTEQVEIQPVEQVVIQPVLERKNYLEKETTTPSPIPEPVKPVVVFCEESEKERKSALPTSPIPEPVVVVDSELTFPVQLTPPQKKAAKAIIKKVKEPELRQPVLFALAYAITNGKITSSVPGYLRGIVNNANNGTFEPISAHGTTKANKPIIPYWQGHKPAERIDNNKFQADLVKQFGDKAKAAITDGANRLANLRSALA